MLHTSMNARTKNLTTILILFLTSLFATAVAQDVSIPDPGLNAAIRDALHKTVGSITQEDMLSLTNVDAGNRNINSLTGLETARNLIALTLFNNHLTNFVLPSEFRKLAVLDIGFNALAQCTLAPRLTNLDTLFLEGNALTNFSLPAGLTGLTRIDLSGNALTRF